MKEELRKTGIDIIGDVSWGTHLCLFYQTKDDLIDILVPYFKAGLENNEFCMWVTAEPLGVEHARLALKKAVKDSDDYIAKGQIEILDYSDWYTKSGRFEANEVLAGWVEKEKEALRKGFAGLRLTGNTIWVEKRDWRDFLDYEAVVNNVIGQYRILAVCTYSLDKCGATEIIDVVGTHQFALIKRADKWEVIESSEHKKAEEAIKESERKYRTLVESASDQIFMVDKEYKLVSANTMALRLFGKKPDEIIGKHIFEVFPKEIAENNLKNLEKVFKTGKSDSVEGKMIVGEHEFWSSTSLNPVKNDSGETIAVLGITRDITDRKRAEEEIKEAEEKFRQLFDNARDGILLADPETKQFFMCNKAICKMLGYNEDEIKHLSVKDIHLDKDLPYALEQFKRLYLEEVIIVENLAMKRKDGSVFYADVLGSLMTLAGRKCLMGTFRDITERKKAEAEQREQISIIESYWGMVALTDMNGLVTYINPAGAKMCGHKDASEVIGIKRIADFLVPEDLQQATKVAIPTALDKCTWTGESRILRPDGSFIPVEQTIFVIRDENGQPCNLGTIIADITNRKKAEDALRASEARYRSNIEVTGQIGWTTSPDGVLVDDLPMWRKFTGQSIEEVKGWGWVKAIHPDDVERTKQVWNKSVATKSPYEIEYRIRRYDGVYCDFLARGIPLLREDGSIREWVGTCIDITERKLAEQKQAELLQQLEKANQELKDFAYIVSHDLKAPLRGVKVLVDWLSTDYADKLDEDGKEQMRLLTKRVDRMHNLIDGIMQYSKIGRVKEQDVKVDLNELLPEIVDMVAPPPNIAITIEGELPTILCERTRIAQVFQNLLSNAVKYMDKPQGQIKVACAEDGGFLKFSVADNGPGIEEKHFDKIFQMFQTLSARDDFESTGVGLTVAKKIVEIYGGRIWVESKVGQGSTFFFTLPKRQSEVKDEILQTSVVG